MGIILANVIRTRCAKKKLKLFSPINLRMRFLTLTKLTTKIVSNEKETHAMFSIMALQEPELRYVTFTFSLNKENEKKIKNKLTRKKTFFQVALIFLLFLIAHVTPRGKANRELYHTSGNFKINI